MQHPDRDIDPSTRPQTHHDTMGSPLGRNKVGFPALSETGLGGHKSCITSADTFGGSVVGHYPTPDRQDTNVRPGVSRCSLFGDERVFKLTSSITSIKFWASFPERYPTTLVVLWSEKMAVIREMRSSIERGSLINRFQAGRSLRNQSKEQTVTRMN